MIQPFGVFLIVFLIKKIFFCRKKSIEKHFSMLFLVLVFLELFVNVGYFVKINNYEVMYDEFILILLAIYCFFEVLRNPSKTKIKFSMLSFTFVLIVTELLLVVNPINESIYRNGIYILPNFSFYSILVFFKVLIMLFVSIVSLHLLNEIEIANLFSKLQKLAIIIYILVLIEWVTKNIFQSNIFHIVVNFIFGRGEYTVDFLLERGSSYSLQGLTREPAHLTFGLFIFAIILIFSKINIKEKHILFITDIIILSLSGSLSGIGYAIALIVIYILNSKSRVKYMLYLIGGAILTAVFGPKELLMYYIGRIINSISLFLMPSADSAYTSEFVRIFSIQETFRTVITKRPFFGAGLGIPYAYSGTIMIISSIGVIGLLAWFYYYFISIGKMKTLTKYISILTMFIILSLIGSISIIYSGYILLLVLQLRYFPSINIINSSESMKNRYIK